MKLLILGLVAGVLVYSPIYLFNTQVEPQLNQLRQIYSNADKIANDAAALEK